MKKKYVEQIKEAYNFEKGMIIFLVIVLLLLLVFKVVPVGVGNESHFKITLEGKEIFLNVDWKTTCLAIDNKERPLSAFNEERCFSPIYYGVEWLNNNCNVFESNCTYIEKRQSINTSKAYISNTQQDPTCLKIEDCFDLVCEGPMIFQCRDYKVEIIK